MSESINTDGLMRECLECGQEFIPDESGEECCSGSCDAAYYGWNDGYEDYDYDMEDMIGDYGDEAAYYGTDWN